MNKITDTGIAAGAYPDTAVWSAFCNSDIHLTFVYLTKANHASFKMG